jgi:hypothetical protein
MDSRNMCADMKMEEGYMRMSIEYNNEGSKNQILSAISSAEKNIIANPDILVREVDSAIGNISVEFFVEGVTREAGEFCESVLKALNLKCS